MRQRIRALTGDADTGYVNTFHGFCVSVLQEDAAVVISGKISVREEEAPKLLAERIARLDDWKKAPAKKETERPLIPDAKAAELAE